ncbi:MAG TPA: helix-turn-helix domain-containing protein [Rhizomicrobium sp.]|jgi:transcriptional regulator with XRE-family HTH domain|nr:helix-turn-helix domain-containing protein [Rhizomicrobium sp.]
MSKVQIIRDEQNEPAYAVLPWSEYKNLTDGHVEDAALIERAIAARNDDKFPAAIARRLAAGEVPLKVIREWRGLAQGQLGELADVAPQYISQIERAARNMGAETARKLAPLLGVSTNALLGDEQQEVMKFSVGQKYRANRTPSRTAEVMQLDAESNGWKAWVDVRDHGKLLQSDWVNYAQFSGHWTLI